MVASSGDDAPRKGRIAALLGHPLVRVAAVVVVLAAGGVGLGVFLTGSAASPSSVASVRTPRAGPTTSAGMIAGLCDAAAAAEEGELRAAREDFTNRAHRQLHAVARLASDSARQQTGELLQAKRVVERDLSTSADSATLAKDLRALTDAARATAEALGGQPPPCERKDTG